MGKLVVVKDDTVEGTDTHTVSGMTLAPPPPVAYAGSGSYKYNGKMTDGLSPFVTIAGKAVAIVTSKSSLNSGETAPGGGGGHDPQLGSDLKPSTANSVTLTFLPPVIGTGVPNSAAGSAFVTIAGTKVLLDGDKIDTCDGTGSGNSTVTSVGQAFVSCSA